MTEDEEAFSRHAEAIRTGYISRKKFEVVRREMQKKQATNGRGEQVVVQPPEPPFEKAESFLKREAYSLIRFYLSNSKRKKAIRELVKSYVGVPKYPDFKDNPYYWGLLAIDNDEGLMGVRRISRYAQLFHYAARNHVPPEYLIGFLFQIGASSNLEGIKHGERRDRSLSMTIPLP